MLDPETQNSPIAVYSLRDRNTVTAGATVLLLDKNQIGIITAGADLDPGSIITGTGPFTLASDRETVDIPSPATFLGTQFIVPHTRNAHRVYLLSPEEDATVLIEVEESTETVLLSPGGVFEYSLGSDNTISSLLESDVPILVTHVADTAGVRSDAFPVPPASLELWGVHSGSAIIGVLEDSTSVVIYDSDGRSEAHTLNRGDRQSISIGAGDIEGQGSGLRIVADKPVTAIQYDDGDGTEAVSFLPSHYLATHHGVSIGTQYLAVVCPDPGTLLTLRDGAQATHNQCL